ncbi:hypothetical protein XaC1_181 [Xanthomonas phage XaC1]|nr:hypothetical protein XaC1_181 [Xanthomonas phage XaC1]
MSTTYSNTKLMLREKRLEKVRSLASRICAISYKIKRCGLMGEWETLQSLKKEFYDLNLTKVEMNRFKLYRAQQSIKY